MDHTDHVNLLRDGIDGAGGVWADLGAGRGAFTLALADLLGPGSEIYAVDRDAGALRENERTMKSRFPECHAQYRVADFTRPLTLPALDGLVMANSLHFQADQEAVVRRVAQYLRPGGRLLIVEYNIERGNFAVPHPVAYRRWVQLAEGAGLESTRLLARRPSRFLHEIYSAVSLVPAESGLGE
jgi:ubiquinone/menaquinone biosynthesis C-methylase UbiE